MTRSSSWSALVRIGPYTLAALIWRANRRCTWCARVVTRETCSIDHVIPRARGGSDNSDNLVLARRVCNLQRYDFGRVPPRAGRARRSVAVCEAEIARQTGIAVGRGTAANSAARNLAMAWFGAYIEKNRRCLAKRRAARLAATAFPFRYAA